MEHSNKSRRVKHLPDSNGVRNYVPYQQQQFNQSGVQGQSGTQANTYTAGQTGVQGQLGPLWQSFLQGNIPSSFTNPAAATTAYNSNFNQNIAPGLASTYGAGSPQIASNNALGLAQLQGNLYNTGVSNYLSGMAGGSNYALGMPVGTSGTTAGLSQSQGTQQTGINPLAFLASLYSQVNPTQNLFGP